MKEVFVDFSTIGAFVLAAIIAFIGISQSKKKDTDRFYECIETMTSIKKDLEDAIAKYINNPQSKEVFNNLNTRYTAFVNHLDSFSAKILNQKLYKTAAFKNFQGESFNGLKDWVVIQLTLFHLIKEASFRDFEIISANVTRKSYLKNTYKLLKITLPNEEYNKLQMLCKEHDFY